MSVNGPCETVKEIIKGKAQNLVQPCNELILDSYDYI